VDPRPRMIVGPMGRPGSGSVRARPIAVLGLAVLLVGSTAIAIASPSRVARGAAAGAVVGTVELELVEEVDPPMLSPYARRRYRPPTPAPAAPGSPVNAVVYVLLDAGVRPPARDTTVAIIQRDRAIIPHVTAVPAGTRIDFPNQDEVFHNLFSLSDARRFNLGRYPPGESRSERFPEAGVVRMFCDIHSEMGGVILVVDTPLLARPDAEGRFRIDGVPPGRHRVVAWHETAGADTAEIVVEDGGTARVAFRLPR
jgi:plastocyanin